MANVEFIRIEPPDLTLEDIHFLEQGADDFGGIASVNHILENYQADRDLFVRICKTDIIGCIYLTITQQEVGKVLSSILLGANGLSQWYEELKKYYYQLAKQYDCNQFIFMGRRGFKRYFSELEEVATVFRVNLK